MPRIKLKLTRAQNKAGVDLRDLVRGELARRAKPTSPVTARATKPRAPRAPKISTSTIYVRVPIVTADSIRHIALTRGHPHTINSVAREQLVAANTHSALNRTKDS